MVNSALPHLSIACSGLDELDDVASKIIEFAGDIRFWIFEAEMGAGKTTLIKSICRQLKVEDNVSSPTYSIINEYETVEGEIIYHFDFYRLKKETEALDIGAEEYFESGNYCFVEWPSKVSSILPDSHFLTVSINLATNENRLIELIRHD